MSQDIKNMIFVLIIVLYTGIAVVNLVNGKEKFSVVWLVAAVLTVIFVGAA